jgi:Ulp1 family protease
MTDWKRNDSRYLIADFLQNNIPDKSLVFLPFGGHHHWILLAMDLRSRCITIYDSWKPYYEKAKKAANWRVSGYEDEIQVKSL